MTRITAVARFVAAALVTVTASEAAAQTPASLEVGSRVRLEVDGISPRPLIGIILSGDQTTLEIQGSDQEGPVVVRRAAITKLQVSLGRRSRARGAGIGALVGFGIGVIPAFVPDREVQCYPNEWLCRTTPKGQRVQVPLISKTAIGLVLGGIGAGVGALIGAVVPPGEKWKAFSTGLRVSIAGPHKRDAGVFWSFEF